MSTTNLQAVLKWAALGDAPPELEAACKELEELISALTPFAQFARQFERMPLNQVRGTLYGIHCGTQYEAEITLDDCRRARVAIWEES